MKCKKILTGLLLSTLIWISCNKENSASFDCNGEIGRFLTVPNCGVAFELEDGTRLSDISLRLWDVEVDNGTLYCISHAEETNPRTDRCDVDFATEFLNVKQIE